MVLFLTPHMGHEMALIFGGLSLMVRKIYLPLRTTPTPLNAKRVTGDGR
ncbi:MAG: hypothetical protein BWY45_02262 [Euryarchaeota archaeon ADurb.Bin294]|nr:MAG: hypothetical protein BWY45_02262 [Euryarchaeota archaeon ADurb.Bin294]